MKLVTFIFFQNVPLTGQLLAKTEQKIKEQHHRQGLAKEVKSVIKIKKMPEAPVSSHKDPLSYSAVLLKVLNHIPTGTPRMPYKGKCK